MADPHLKSTLERKALEIEGLLEQYRRIMTDAQADLVHVRGTISLFERDKVRRAQTPHFSLATIFKRGETFAMITKALSEHPGGLDTRELAERCMRAKGLDGEDRLVRQSMMQNIAQMLQVRKNAGQVEVVGKRGLTCVWKLANF